MNKIRKTQLTNNSISISLVYLIAAKTSWLPENPMLWFVMMLMPTGPSAMKVMVLADVADAEHKDKMIIAKFLAVSTTSLWQIHRLIYSDHLRHLPFDDIGCHRRSQSLRCCHVGMHSSRANPSDMLSFEHCIASFYSNEPTRRFA